MDMHIPKYDLIPDLLNNIIIISDKDQMLYSGSEINTLLAKADIKIEKLLKGEFNEDGKHQNFISALKNIRKNNKTYYFKFENVPTEFLLLPVFSENEKNIILSTCDKVLNINSIEYNLKERVKELECLYNISFELEKPKNINEAIEHSILPIIKGFQYSKITRVYIEIDGILHGDLNCKNKRPPDLLEEDIIVNGKRRGSIKVCYQKKAEFLEEERKLLKEITGKISRAIDRKERSADLQNQQKELLQKNKALTKISEKYKSSRAQLQTFFRAITDYIIVIDKEFNIIMSNNEEIGNNGKCFEKIFHSDKICDECPTIESFREGEKSYAEKRTQDKTYMLRSYPILNKKNKVEGVLEVCRDITKEKKMEFQLMQSYKLASLGKLVSGIAHEINNPNTFILGNIKIIKEAFQDILPVLDNHIDEIKDLKIARLNYDIFRENIPVLLDDMENGANRMKKIVQDLRNFAKKDEGLLTEKVDINQVINNSLRLIENQIKRNALVELHLSEEIPDFKGNNQKLEQVFVNMLVNASQAIESGKGEIIVKTKAQLAAEEVTIQITDNGKGIDPGNKKFIFDPFFTTKRNKGGTGLGLSISYGIIHEHNGKIEVESEMGKGTTFTIRLPIKEKQE